MRSKTVSALILLGVLVLAGTPVLAGDGDQPDLTISAQMLKKSLNLRYRKAKRKSCTVKEGCVGGTGRRRTLEFDTWIVNLGPADVTLGAPQDRPDLFEFSACHMHYHMKGSLDYTMSHGGTDTGGVYEPGAGSFALRNVSGEGDIATTFGFGGSSAGTLAVAGDWNGDGDSTVGVYDAATGTFTLAEKNIEGAAAATLHLGTPGAGQLPISGDWNGDGKDTVGLFNRATGMFTLADANEDGAPTTSVQVAATGDEWAPIAGDWNGDDIDSIGLYDVASGQVLLWNTLNGGSADLTYTFHPSAGPLVPMAGDWNQDGIDSVAVYDRTTGRVSFRNMNTSGGVDGSYALAVSATGQPLAGDWDYNEGDLLLAGHKQAYCWLDNQRVSGTRDPQFANCNFRQGLTAGYADMYIRGLDCQWIDITNLAPGTYQLRVKVNTGRFVRESNYDNNIAIVKVNVPAPRHRPERAPEPYAISLNSHEHVDVGQPVTFKWKVRNASRVTHQQLFVLLESHDEDGDGEPDHPGLTMLIGDDLPADARSFTWTPTADFQVGRVQLLVRAQDEHDSVGTDAVSSGTIEVGEHHGEKVLCKPCLRR